MKRSVELSETWPPVAKEAMWKPPKGSHVLEREEQQAKVKKHGIDVAQAVKRLDGRCRWPEVHKCRGGLEAAHLQAKKMGGDHGTVTTPENLITLCAWIHRRGPESLHGGQLAIEPEAPTGARGPCGFYRRGEDNQFYLIVRERAPFILDRD